MQQIILLVAMTLILTACGGSSSEEPTTPPPPPVSDKVTTILSGSQTVERFYLDGDAQLAGTTTGLFWRADANSDWQNRSPEDSGVADIVVLGSGQYIIAMTPTEGTENSEAHPLYQTSDSGQTWDRISHNFGREFFSVIRSLTYDISTDSIYAVSLGALAKADSSAENWTLLDGDWSTFATGLRLLEYNHAKQAIWFGGQGAIENGYLKRFNIADDFVVRWDDLLPNPHSFMGGLIHPHEPNTVMFGGEGGIAISYDHGASWERPLGDVNHRFYWDIVIDAAGVLYTAGWDKGGPEQPLIVECSSDNGYSWKSHHFGNQVSRGGVKSLSLVEHEDETMLYLGLEANGIKAISTDDLECP